MTLEEVYTVTSLQNGKSSSLDNTSADHLKFGSPGVAKESILIPLYLQTLFLMSSCILIPLHLVF